MLEYKQWNIFYKLCKNLSEKKNHSYSGSENPNFAGAPDPN